MLGDAEPRADRGKRIVVQSGFRPPERSGGGEPVIQPFGQLMVEVKMMERRNVGSLCRHLRTDQKMPRLGRPVKSPASFHDSVDELRKFHSLSTRFLPLRRLPSPLGYFSFRSVSDRSLLCLLMSMPLLEMKWNLRTSGPEKTTFIKSSNLLKKIAERKGLSYTSLLRMWIKKHISREVGRLS